MRLNHWSRLAKEFHVFADFLQDVWMVTDLPSHDCLPSETLEAQIDQWFCDQKMHQEYDCLIKASAAVRPWVIARIRQAAESIRALPESPESAVPSIDSQLLWLYCVVAWKERLRLQWMLNLVLETHSDDMG